MVVKRMVSNHVSIYAQVHKLNAISESELTFVSVFHFTIINLLDQTTAKGSLDILQFLPLFKIYHCRGVVILVKY